MPEIAIVVDSQETRYAELVAMLRQELEQLRVSTTVSAGEFRRPRRGLVYLLVGAHRLLADELSAANVHDELLRRSIVFATEPLDTGDFAVNTRLGTRGAIVFDIAQDGVELRRRAGVDARHFQLGYTSFWDHAEGAPSARDIDFVFLGRATPRRERLLASYAPSLCRWRSHLTLGDGRWPDYDDASASLQGADKWRLLAAAKVLLNLQRTDSYAAFDWLQAAQAIHTGAVFACEHSTHFEPLQPQVHFLSARAESLVLIAQEVLEDERERQRMRSHALELLRRELPMRRSVESLVAAATEVDGRRVVAIPPQVPPLKAGWARGANRNGAEEQPETDAETIKRGIKELKLDLVALRRNLDRLQATQQGSTLDPPYEEIARSGSYRGATPRVSVVVAVYNHASHLRRALDSIAGNIYSQVEVVVVDDHSTDASLLAAVRWLEDHPAIPGLVLRNRFNRGQARSRNTAFDQARGEFCLVLDADNEMYPHCISRLVQALDAQADAAFAYGELEAFDGSGSLGLRSSFPCTAERLRGGPYIDAFAVIRKSELARTGGYAAEIQAGGWEDHDLWCNIVEHGGAGAFVPEILGRYRVESRLTSLVRISHSENFARLRQRYPKLMSGQLDRVDDQRVLRLTEEEVSGGLEGAR